MSSSIFKRIFSIPTLVLLVAIVFLAKTYLYKDKSGEARYHGPNPNILSSYTITPSILGRNTSRRRVPTPTPSKIPTPNPTSSLTISPSPIITQKNRIDFGIAGAGILIYLNQSDLDNYFKKLVELGVNWVRFDVEWGAVQRNNSSNYDWSGIDRVVAAAKAAGINSLGTIAYAPKWARDPACSDRFTCQPADPIAFGVFAGQAALRYKNSITHWEIWNEPNIVSFWRPRPSLNLYIEFLKQAYTQIKKVSPDSVVMTGGLAASGNDSEGNMSIPNFVDALYAANAQPYFDAIAIHPYTFPTSPYNTAFWNAWTQLSTVHQTMITKGDNNKKIWITEFGVPTGGPGVVRQIDDFGFVYDKDFMSEASQQLMAQQAIGFYRNNQSWLGTPFWYSFHDLSTATDTPENFFGLFRYDWSKKPAYNTLRNGILGTY